MAYDELTAKLVSENTTLRAEVERLRAALQHISNLSPTEPHAMQIKARAALAEEALCPSS
jgi:regulator of replication initiation timing